MGLSKMERFHSSCVWRKSRVFGEKTNELNVYARQKGHVFVEKTFEKLDDTCRLIMHVG